MARNTEAVCRKCRREGFKLTLKGSRCDTEKCAFNRRSNAPGMHGARKGKLTDYGVHLREKQKVKNYYGVLEKQFRKYFGMAERMKGNTGKVLMGLLERRLDNIVYRLGFGASRPQARQWVSHGHIQVNGRRVDIPSYLVRMGDVITIRNRPKSTKAIKIVIEEGLRDVPEFLYRDNADIPKGVVMRLPTAEDVTLPVDSALIVELCSK
ncbi:MAG: 30S ribosomal protein S4 [Planctomycetaceae bacterium]|jgi:small subunit ribosomal protein S4|nr:30S ribosomal protein S4 [Planctomycetaceae bacterium]